MGQQTHGRADNKEVIQLWIMNCRNPKQVLLHLTTDLMLPNLNIRKPRKLQPLHLTPKAKIHFSEIKLNPEIFKVKVE